MIVSRASKVKGEYVYKSAITGAPAIKVEVIFDFKLSGKTSVDDEERKITIKEKVGNTVGGFETVTKTIKNRDQMQGLPVLSRAALSTEIWLYMPHFEDWIKRAHIKKTGADNILGFEGADNV